MVVNQNNPITSGSNTNSIETQNVYLLLARIFKDALFLKLHSGNKNKRTMKVTASDNKMQNAWRFICEIYVNLRAFIIQ
jgi:hypothetical protein